MGKLSSQFAAFVLCALLLIQEFGPAHFADVSLGSANLDTVNRNKDQPEMTSYDDTADLRPQKEAVGTSSKRGWMTGVFKAIKIGGKVLSATSTVAGLGNSIFRAITGCCTDFPDACRYRDEFNMLKTQIAEKSKRADDLELEAENLQIWTNYSINKFEDILQELNEIANEQEQYLESLSPEVAIVLNNETKKIQEFIKKKNNLAETVEYMEIASMYESAIESVMNIGFPIVSLVMPVGAKIYKFSKQRVTSRNTAKVESASGVSLKVPAKSSPAFKRSKLSKFLSSTKSKVTAKISSIKTTLNSKYSKTVKIAKGIGQGFKVAMNYLNAGLQIWMIIQSRESCRQRRDDAKTATEELRNAMKKFNKAIEDITEAKNIMETSFDYLRGNVTAESVTEVLKNIKSMVEEVSSQSQEMVEVAGDIQSFLDEINTETSYEQTYDLEEMLLKTLHKIPFTLSCYTNKIKMINYVVDLCKKGRASFDALYKEAQENFDTDDPSNPENPQNCERKIGFKYINKADLKKAWQKTAKEQGFSENCVLNDATKKTTACSYNDNGFDSSYIAEKMFITEADAKELVKDCAEKTSLTPKEKEQVCSFRKTLSLTDEQIAGAMGIDLNLVKHVQCA